MNKTELKKMLRPLIKECIKEVIFEEGTLSTIISEVMIGTAQHQQPLMQENKQTEDYKNVQRKKSRGERLFLILLGMARTMALIFLRGLHHCPIETAARQMRHMDQKH